LSAVERKLVVIDSFSDVVYLARISALLADQGSNESSSELALDFFPSSCREVRRLILKAK